MFFGMIGAKWMVGIWFLILGMTACSHVSDGLRSNVMTERRSTASEIAENIIGLWAWSDKSDAEWYSKIEIASDGNLFGILSSGERILLGKWEMNRHMLILRNTTERIEASGANGFKLNEADFFPVIYADAHELVMAPGITVVGRYRFTK